jgi:glycosyltransferase involved in cell wall biosynthesis
MHVSTRLILGGSQENTVLSCEGQAAAGHVVSLVYGPIYGPEGSLLDRVRRHGGIEAIEIKRLVRQVAPWTDVRCALELRRLVRRWRPDVVHTHSSKAGILGRWAAWSARVPCVVHTIHGLPFHPYQNRVVHGMYVAAERFAARRCHRIVCVAEAMRQQAQDAGIGRPAQYAVVYSGMEVERYIDVQGNGAAVRRALGFAPGDFVVGTVARLAELKGHDDLLDALPPLLRQRPRIKLLWVGGGWWRDRLLRRVEELGLRDRVVTAGLVASEEIPRYIQAMDLLVHPSYREGLPRTVVQALLGGVPAMAYDVDGTREVCLDGRTGRLLAPGDLSGLRDAVAWMMDHEGERRAMAEAGRALCRSRFDAGVMVEKLGRLYDEVLDARPGAERAG